MFRVKFTNGKEVEIDLNHVWVENGGYCFSGEITENWSISIPEKNVLWVWDLNIDSECLSEI